MATPHDRESLLAAWESIGSSNPFPAELQDLCLAYFKNLHQPCCSEINSDLTPEKELPPTRYVRQQRAEKRARSGPVNPESFDSYSSESWTAGQSSLNPVGFCVYQQLKSMSAAESLRTNAIHHKN
jgi:hypothetical protein